MMKNKIYIFIILVFLVSCSNSSNITNTSIKIERVSVQELDDEEYIKKISFEPNKNAINKFNIVNQNFKTIPKLDECNNIDNIKTKNYSIKSYRNLDSKNKSYYSIYTYDKKAKQCKLLKKIKSANVYKAVEFNNKLYLEVDNFALSKKRNLVEFDGKTLTTKKADIYNVSNFVILKDILIFSNGPRLDYIDKNGKVNNIKNDDKYRVFTLFKTKDILYIVKQDTKDNSLYLSKYDVTEKIADISKLGSYKKIGTEKININDKEYIRKLDQEITKQTSDYVIIGSKLICNSDMSTCKYVMIDGEKIIDVVDNYVLYLSDRVYLSDFNTNKKEVVLSDYYSKMKITDNKLIFKLSKNLNDYVYIEYQLNKNEK